MPTVPAGTKSSLARTILPLLILCLVIGILSACTPDEAAFTAPTPTASLTPAPTSTPAAPSPTASNLSPPSAVSITPLEQTLPAGASTSFSINTLKETEGASSPAHWSVEGLPPEATAEFLPEADCDSPTLVIHTACSTPQGRHTLDVLADGSQRTSAAIYLSGRLTNSQSDSLTGSFTYGEETIDVRRGGPSTLQYGPFTVLQFCESDQPRKLRVSIESVTSDAGTPLSEPPAFSLLRSLVWPTPDEVQVTGSGAAFKPNAWEVARGNGGDLVWDIESGLYLLVFQRSPFGDANPAEKRPASVAYRVEVTP